MNNLKLKIKSREQMALHYLRLYNGSGYWKDLDNALTCLRDADELRTQTVKDMTNEPTQASECLQRQ